MWWGSTQAAVVPVIQVQQEATLAPTPVGQLLGPDGQVIRTVYPPRPTGHTIGFAVQAR